MKVCLIYQPCGLGDILFCLKIAVEYIKKGYAVVWPVIHEFQWLKDYIPWIQWVSWGDEDRKLTHMDQLPDSVQFPYKEKYNPYAPCEFSDEFVYINGFLPPSGHIMNFKYLSAGVEMEDWQSSVIFIRNAQKELDLMSMLCIKPGDDYVFVNKNYQTRPAPLSHNISTDRSVYGKHVVEMRILHGFSIFDWIPVVCGASEIHMIETSLNYVLESPLVKPNISASKLELYSRYNNFHEVRHLFTLPWHYNT